MTLQRHRILIALLIAGMSMVHHVAALQEVFQGHLCEIEIDLVRPSANLSLHVTN